MKRQSSPTPQSRGVCGDRAVSAQVDHLKLKPLRECPYLSLGREVVRYFNDSTEGRYYIPNKVTTGPCDTVNYATGSTMLLRGFYEDPKAVHDEFHQRIEPQPNSLNAPHDR